MKAISKRIGGFTYRVALPDGVAMGKNAVRAADAAVGKLGESIKAESTAIAPLRTGALIASARVSPGKDHSVIIRYEKLYALPQHEKTYFRHPNGRKAKYLESVMRDPATAQAARDLFAQGMKKTLET